MSEKNSEHIVERELPVPLTDIQRLTIGEEIAQVQETLEAQEKNKKDANDSFKQNLKTCRNQLSSLAHTLRVGSIVRTVQCQEQRDYNLQELRIIRMDTEEVVVRRSMTPDELQIGLGFTTNP